MANEALKALRKQRGWSQEELAQRANIPLSTLQKIEQEQFTPSVELAREIAVALGTAIEDVFLPKLRRIRLNPQPSTLEQEAQA